MILAMSACTQPEVWAPVRVYKAEENYPDFTQVVVEGDFAYVIGLSNDMLIYDVSDPVNAFIVGQFIPKEGYLLDIEVSAGLAYLVNRLVGLQVVDISNPAKPILVDEFRTSSGNSLSLLVHDSLIYFYEIYNNDSDFEVIHILDISSPLNIEEIGSLNHFGQPLAVSDGYLFTSKYISIDHRRSQELNIIDVSNIAQPVNIFQDSSYGMIRTMFLVEDVLYLGTGRGLTILNVANPKKPIVLGIKDKIFPLGMVVAGNNLYYRKAQSVKVVDISNPADPKVLSVSEYMLQANDIVLSSGFIYVAGTEGLYVFETWDE